MTRARDLAAFVSNADQDINLDADGGQLIFKDGGTQIGRIRNVSSGELTIQSDVSDKDIVFNGKDGSSTVTALTLDMSDAGTAVFNKGATFGSDVSITSGTNASLNVNDAVGEVGTGNLALQVTNSAGSALKPLGFRAENIRFATGSAERVRITDDGLTFNGDSAAPNALDDYEEGTHAATFAMNTSGSLSMLRQNLGYIKIGRLVTITGEVSVSSVSSPVGSMTMSLPFTISANGTGRDTFMGSKPVAYHVPHHQDNTPVIIGNNNVASVTFVYEQDDAAFASYTPQAGETFNMSFSYITT